MQQLPAALLWDVDGTLAETELDGHRLAFNRAMAEAGLPWQWDAERYLSLLRISGGLERLAFFLQQMEGAPADPDRVEGLQRAKQRHYRALVAAGELQLRPGVQRLMREAASAGLPQVIVTTSGRSAVQALLDRLLPDHPQLLHRWICGEDVRRKKPDPEAYLQALAGLGLAPATTLAIEDSANGVAAAHAAGVPVLVTRSASSAAEADAAFQDAVAMLDHLGEPHLPSTLLAGSPCPNGCVTVSYLQQLLRRA